MPNSVSGLGVAVLRAQIVRLELKRPWTLSRNTSVYKENVLVEIEKNGITGFGEAAPNIRYNENAESTLRIIKGVGDLYSDSDFYQYENIEQKIKSAVPDNSCARAALDMALLDWLGKATGQSINQLLKIPCGKIPPTSFSIGIDQPDIIRKKVEAASEYKILKVKLGADNDQDIIKTIREISDKPIRVDVNEGWKDKYEALDKINSLQSQGIELIEQPMPAKMIEEAFWLRERIDIPLIADEAVKTIDDIPALTGAYDGVNIKLMKAGGVQEALRMINLSKKSGLKIMLGCMIETSTAIAAALQLASLTDYVDLDGHLLISNDPFCGVTIVDGRFAIPDQPGLGIQKNNAALTADFDNEGG